MKIIVIVFALVMLVMAGIKENSISFRQVLNDKPNYITLLGENEARVVFGEEWGYFK